MFHLLGLKVLEEIQMAHLGRDISIAIEVDDVYVVVIDEFVLLLLLWDLNYSINSARYMGL
jgi:hypothetical protein